MAEDTNKGDKANKGETPKSPALTVAPGPHVFAGAQKHGGRLRTMLTGGMTTRRMMLDVLVALVPVVGVSVWVFGWRALVQLGVCVVCCLAAEAVFTRARARAVTLGDLSAVVTGAILAMSLPATAPWYIGAIGSFAAIGLGKIVFGGLGANLFNPAMVGRAFVMIAFPVALGASGYVLKAPGDARSAAATAGEAVSAASARPDAITRPTPMADFKQNHTAPPLWELAKGTTNGSLGETSAIACLIGGLYLCLRRTASWEIPLGVILAAGAIAGAINLGDVGSEWTVLHDLAGGALLFGAFFIATDPVSSPLTPKGKVIFGLGIGALVMCLRRLSGYPEGVMFAVLIMNSLVPLINRWTVPRPVGGPVPAKG